jgi:hypothetical protein
MEVTEGVKKGYFFTKYSLFLKEGGVEHYIDEVMLNRDGSVSYLHTRNSKTGKSEIRLMSELNKGHSRDTYFFKN